MEHFEKLLTGLMYNQFITIRIKEPDQTQIMIIVAAVILIVGIVTFIALSKDSIGEMFYLISCKNVVLNEFKATQYKL